MRLKPFLMSAIFLSPRNLHKEVARRRLRGGERESERARGELERGAADKESTELASKAGRIMTSPGPGLSSGQTMLLLCRAEDFVFH
jgi:hypothetical protein